MKGLVLMENQRGLYCQMCKFHKNRPATCSQHHIFIARKSPVCTLFVKKGGK